MTRRQRIPGLEMAIYAQARIEFGASAKEHDPSLRSNMIELKTVFKYEKQLRNLQLQEARLARRYDKEFAELRTLQKERIQRELRRQQAAAKSLRPTERTVSPELGFEFPTGSLPAHDASDHRSANLADRQIQRKNAA